jgi:hypothetical protein
MIATGYFLFHRQKKWLHFTLLSHCSLLLLLIGQQLYFNSIQEIAILHYPKQSMILLQHNGFTIPLKNSQNTPLINHPYVHLHQSTALHPPTAFLNQTLFYSNHQLIYSQDTLLILSRQSSYYTPCSILVITENLLPQHVLQFTPHPLPKQIILDGSNHKYTITAWEAFCEKHQINFKNTTENGYVQIRLK